MEHSVHNFKGRFTTIWFDINRDAPSVVFNGYRIIFMHCYCYCGTVSSQAFMGFAALDINKEPRELLPKGKV